MLRYVIQSAALSWPSNYVLWPSDPSLEAMDLAWRGFCNRPLQTMCSYTLSPFFKTSHLNLGLAMLELLWSDCESLHTSKKKYLTRANNNLFYTFTLILHIPLLRNWPKLGAIVLWVKLLRFEGNWDKFWLKGGENGINLHQGSPITEPKAQHSNWDENILMLQIYSHFNTEPFNSWQCIHIFTPYYWYIHHFHFQVLDITIVSPTNCLSLL